MSLATVSCRAQLGMLAPVVHVEVSIDSGLPSFSIVGLPATVVRESKDRVRAALVNSNLEFPAGRITVNLSPADIPKRGGRFDLPIALGILLASGQLRHGPTLQGQEYYGELGLGGELRAVHGMLLTAACAGRAGHEILVPQANADEVRTLLARAPLTSRSVAETSAVPVMRAAEHLLEVCAHISGSMPLPLLTPPLPAAASRMSERAADLSDVRGQSVAKRALVIAAAGGHSLLMKGWPGTGKTMLAMRLPGLLPPLTDSEALEVAAIASVSGVGFNAAAFGRRPVRTPHHTASAVSLIGGGSIARPGEITLAHRGVLFLDELLEYDRRALEALREPLESGVITISRATYHTQYPAEFQLVAAMNPCPCGRDGDPTGECHCTPHQIDQYLGRVSAPLMERFDLQISVPRVDLSDFDESEPQSECSANVAERVKRVREIQVARQGSCNARLEDGQISRLCCPDAAGRAILDSAMKKYDFSARTRQRILKLARTIADLNGDSTVGKSHVSEAVQYRGFGRRKAVAAKAAR